MVKIFKASLIVAIGMVILGCRNQNNLQPLPCQKGMYCYKNINFGKSRGSSYEKGIRDGCKTGEGTFTKDYYLSSTNKNYYDGWILGRSKCHQILPNEGTLLEQENSKRRAEYQIKKLKMEQEMIPQKEDIIDSLIESDSQEQVQDVEY